jgi:azurin
MMKSKFIESAWASAWVVTSMIGISAASLPVPTALAKSEKTSTLTVSTKGDELAFNKTTLKAKAGQPVSVTFQNKASASSNLQHNWVLVKPGTAETVSTAGISAGPDKGYIPDSPDIIAHTKLLNPGQKETVSFAAPAAPGDYPYICSFPGHATTMKGVLKVK